MVWDRANSSAAAQEQPAEGAGLLRSAIRHVHIKDVRRDQDEWRYVLTDEGDFPLLELKATLDDLHYNRFVSFEWEKKWHPEIAEAEISLPHFARLVSEELRMTEAGGEKLRKLRAEDIPFAA